jgi:hypothetical protein
MSRMWRPTDRAEYVLGRVLVMGVLLLVVMSASAFAAGYSTRMGRGHDTAGATATALEPDRGAAPTAARPGETTPAGPVLGSGSAAGVGVGIWVDERGRPVPQPPGADRALLRAATDAATVLIAGGALLGGLWWAARRAITSRNLRRWEREWRRVGPEWSRGAR